VKVSLEWAAREDVPHVAPSLKTCISVEHHRVRERRTYLSTRFSFFRCRYALRSSSVEPRLFELMLFSRPGVMILVAN
jgi:hypothetical protein